MSIELRERAIKAAKRYLEIQGLEVIDDACVGVNIVFQSPWDDFSLTLT